MNIKAKIEFAFPHNNKSGTSINSRVFIVASILGNEHSRLLTILIGLSETLMTVWILSGIKTRLNAATQILVIATMNTLEFILVPDLLFWGKANSIFAFMFILLIYYNGFHVNKKLAQQI